MRAIATFLLSVILVALFVGLFYLLHVIIWVLGIVLVPTALGLTAAFFIASWLFGSDDS